MHLPLTQWNKCIYLYKGEKNKPDRLRPIGLLQI